MEIKVFDKDGRNIVLPMYGSENAAGADVRASIDNPIVLKPLERCAVPTGLYVEIPNGYEIQVRPRSGLALKSGVTVLNTPGTIDSDYRGQVKVILVNLSNEDFRIENGDRIAQLVVAKVERLPYVLTTESLSETERGEGGFGHTGVR